MDLLDRLWIDWKRHLNSESFFVEAASLWHSFKNKMTWVRTTLYSKNILNSPKLYFNLVSHPGGRDFANHHWVEDNYAQQRQHDMRLSIKDNQVWQYPEAELKKISIFKAQAKIVIYKGKRGNDNKGDFSDFNQFTFFMIFWKFHQKSNYRNDQFQENSESQITEFVNIREFSPLIIFVIFIKKWLFWLEIENFGISRNID